MNYSAITGNEIVQSQYLISIQIVNILHEHFTEYFMHLCNIFHATLRLYTT